MVESADIAELDMDVADGVEFVVKFQKGVPDDVGSGGQSGWANDQYVMPAPLLGKFVGQINGVADKSLINCCSCESEYDSTDRRLAGELGTVVS